MNKPNPDFFNAEMARSYDERNSKLNRISECLHFLTILALKDLPANSKVLCVGAGTGAEILSLAKAYPSWQFVALEPSKSMLDVCQKRLEETGLSDRCEFVHGYVQDMPTDTKFEAVLAILVAHFIKRDERLRFFQEMALRVRPGGFVVNAEISFDLNSLEFPPMLKNWEEVQSLMGATPESLAMLPKALKEVLTVLPPEKTEDFFRQSGLSYPVRYFQAFMIHAWYGKKSN